MQFTKAEFLLIFILEFCKPETNWKSRQSEHVSLNYTHDALSRFCQQTDIGRIDGYLDQIAVPRPVGSENHKKVALFIRFTLENLGYSTEFVSFTASTVNGVKNFTNIVATKHPLAEKRLVLACHYDSKSFETFTFVGATDSALPCALMLDAAQTLNHLMPTKAKDDLTLQLAFFDGEEAFLAWDTSDSLYGSRYLAHLWSNQKYKNQRRNSHSRLSSELDRIDVLILLDLLGARGLRINNFATNDAKVYELFPQIESQLSDVPGCLSPSVGRIFDDFLSYMRIQDDHIPFFNRRSPIIQDTAKYSEQNVEYVALVNPSPKDPNTIQATLVRVEVLAFIELPKQTINDASVAGQNKQMLGVDMTSYRLMLDAHLRKQLENSWIITKSRDDETLNKTTKQTIQKTNIVNTTTASIQFCHEPGLGEGRYFRFQNGFKVNDTLSLESSITDQNWHVTLSIFTRQEQQIFKMEIHNDKNEINFWHKYGDRWKLLGAVPIKKRYQKNDDMKVDVKHLQVDQKAVFAVRIDGEEKATLELPPFLDSDNLDAASFHIYGTIDIRKYCEIMNNKFA